MRHRILIVACLALAGSSARAAPPASALSAPAPSVDYGDAANWICRPGEEATCTQGLDAKVMRGDGSSMLQAFHPAVDAPIDCFYVYPTASRETTDYSDLQPTPEIKAVVHDQAGRLTAHCRLFAPTYRQLTSAGLKHGLEAAHGGQLDFNEPYQDVLAAWRWYVANANHGRGVVLIGHSQGTILLQRLIAEEVDGKPVQKRLVAAFLAGDPGLPVPVGARVGGVFKSVPLCAAAAQTGCAYVWSDYLADDDDASLVFGVNPGDGLAAGCADPAAPGGGSGPLKAYLHKPAFMPEGDPPWIEVVDQLSVACVADAHNTVARVTILPTRYQALLATELGRSRHRGGWGLHPLDVALTQGNMVDRLEAESAAWTAQTGR